MTLAQIADVKSGAGLVDVTTALQNALNAGVSYCPPGTFLLSSSITVVGTLRCAGVNKTTFKTTPKSRLNYGSIP